MSRMADELETNGTAEIKEAAPHAPPSPPWWHEAGFNTAGKELLSKFAEVTKVSQTGSSDQIPFCGVLLESEPSTSKLIPNNYHGVLQTFQLLNLFLTTTMGCYRSFNF